MYDDNEEWIVCAGPDCEEEFARFPSNKKYCSQACKRASDSARRAFDALMGMKGAQNFEVDEEDSDVDEVTELYKRNAFLRKENQRLQNLCNKYKNSADETIDVVLKTIRDNVKSIQVKPPKNKSGMKKASTLVINPWNSDLQLGKTTPTYNTAIAYERVELYTDYILDYYKDFSQSYNIPKAHVYFLGDIVEGEGIYPTQSHQVDTSVFRQASVDAPQIYAAQIERMLEVIPEIKITAVIGNHGRISRDANPESNMDRVFYQILYWMFAKEPRVQFDIPQGHGESFFYAVDSIGDYSTLLVHGDQFGSPATQTSYKGKILGWKTGGIAEKFDDVALGHWHHNNKFTIGTTVVRISGSPESSNFYAQERLGVMARPSQHLQMVDPKSGVLWESDVFLD